MTRRLDRVERVAALIAVGLSLLLAPAALSAASSVGTDETVILFPTNASLDEAAGVWKVPLHGWIFEAETDSLWRGAVVEGLLDRLELDPRAAGNELFRERARLFLVDNERGERVPLRIVGCDVVPSRSGSNGHFMGGLRVDMSAIDAATGGRWRRVEALLPADDARHFSGAVQFLGPDGISVVSDLDDTIKVSNVADKRELLANTFLRAFRAVPAMAAAYRRWASAGAAFHYVSSSPWQLYPALSAFMAEAGFPAGSYHLKRFRLKDRTFFDLFADADAHKLAAIEGLLRDYPRRRFLLVGDSGERDPEIYGTVARRRPDQIAHIFIRQVPGQGVTDGRYEAAFAAVPESRWTVFRDPGVLSTFDPSD